MGVLGARDTSDGRPPFLTGLGVVENGRDYCIHFPGNLLGYSASQAGGLVVLRDGSRCSCSWDASGVAGLSCNWSVCLCAACWKVNLLDDNGRFHVSCLIRWDPCIRTRHRGLLCS